MSTRAVLGRWAPQSAIYGEGVRRMSDYEVTVQLTLKIRTTDGVIEMRGGTDGFSAALREYLMNVDGLLHFVQQHVVEVTGAAVTVEPRDSAGTGAKPQGPKAHAAEGSSPT